MTDLVLADDHAAFADALAAVLENHGMTVVAVERTLAGTVAATGRCRPELCVVDRWFDDGDALEVLPALRVASPATRVVVLSADQDRGTPRMVIDAGAHGFVHKTRGVPTRSPVSPRAPSSSRSRRGGPPRRSAPPTTSATRSRR
jgi:two-component system nitrate/nitrite response regulator NarL